MVDAFDSKSNAFGFVGSSPTAPIQPPPKQVPAKSAVMNTYGRFPLELVRGRGVWVWDHTSKKYLDCVAGIAVCLRPALMHGPDAIQRQGGAGKIVPQLPPLVDEPQQRHRRAAQPRGKRGQVVEPGASLCGTLEVVDIGIPRAAERVLTGAPVFLLEEG